MSPGHTGSFFTLESQSGEPGYVLAPSEPCTAATTDGWTRKREAAVLKETC